MSHFLHFCLRPRLRPGQASGSGLRSDLNHMRGLSLGPTILLGPGEYQTMLELLPENWHDPVLEALVAGAYVEPSNAFEMLSNRIGDAIAATQPRGSDHQGWFLIELALLRLMRAHPETEGECSAAGLLDDLPDPI